MLVAVSKERVRASDPMGVTVSRRKLLQLSSMPWILAWTAGFNPWWLDYEQWVGHHLHRCDSRAALVVHLEPLLVAAYDDELDCVAMLEFPAALIGEHGLEVGSRLVTVNGHWENERPVTDLLPGPGGRDHWTNFQPFIADFLSDEMDVIEVRKARIEDWEWQRCAAAAAEHLCAGLPTRLGDPEHSDAGEGQR